MDWQILRRDSSHGTQPAGVERPDEEVRHDAPLRLLSEVMDQGKARPSFPCDFGQTEKMFKLLEYSSSLESAIVIQSQIKKACKGQCKRRCVCGSVNTQHLRDHYGVDRCWWPRVRALRGQSGLRITV